MIAIENRCLYTGLAEDWVGDRELSAAADTVDGERVTVKY